MISNKRYIRCRLFLAVLLLFFAGISKAAEPQPHLAYLVSDVRIPFWDIMKRGIVSQGEALNYHVDVYSAENSSEKELINTVKALKSGVVGIILSPTNSSNAVTILELAASENVPVVIADIGTDGGEYVSYISSDNLNGAYSLGKILAQAFRTKGWDNPGVGIIAIPQKRENGRARTSGFLHAMNDAGFKSVGLRQQRTFSYQETYDFAIELINENPKLHALWLQGSDRYQAALDAIKDSDKQGEILLLCFDAEPEFIDMLKAGALVAAGMQQPFMIGEIATEALHNHLVGKPVEKNISLPVLAVSPENVDTLMPKIKRNVLGLEAGL